MKAIHYNYIENNNKTNIITELLMVSGLVAVTLVSAIVLSSVRVNADTDTVDEVSITVPSACTMSGSIATGNEHTASITPNTYQNNIGKTTITTFCNDAGGYAIYAIGYTGDKYDGEDHTKLIGTNTNQKIVTGTAKTGNSQWAMRVTPVTGTYAPTIENSYDSENYHIVPDTYEKVATYGNSTDATGGTGSSIETTYAAYISGTQAADTYTGKVKYTLVHPSTGPAPVGEGKVGVNYIGNGKTFAGGASENRVVYAASPMYIGTTARIAKSPNVLEDGTQNGGIAADTDICDPITFTGAAKLKIVINYDLTSDGNTFISYVNAAVNNYDDASNWVEIAGGSEGTETIYLDGESVTFNTYTESASNDYGFWAQVYPIYTTEQEGTEPSDEFISLTADTGTYATTTDWYGSWYADINNTHYDFLDETEVMNFLENNFATLNGTTVNLYRGLSFTEAYTRANKSQDGGYYKQQELAKSMCNTIAVTQNQTLKDIRDGNTYMAGKLKDGNCWMLDNLALDPTDATTAANMNASNTNATSAAINNLLHGGSTTTGWSNVAVANVDTNFDSYIAPMINNASKDTLVTSYGPASTNGQAKVGIYYNYCAASAGTYCYESGQGVDVPDTLIDADQDLCPANWRMPTGWDGEYQDGEYQNLIGKYTIFDATATDSLQYNLSTPLSGDFWGDSANGQGSYGEFWSSSFNDEDTMYVLHVGSDDAGYGGNIRGNGHSLRCLVGS